MVNHFPAQVGDVFQSIETEVVLRFLVLWRDPEKEHKWQSFKVFCLNDENQYSLGVTWDEVTKKWWCGAGYYITMWSEL